MMIYGGKGENSFPPFFIYSVIPIKEIFINRYVDAKILIYKYKMSFSTFIHSGG